MSLESEQLLGEQQLGKMRTPSESPGGGKSIPRLAGGQLCQVLAPAPTRMVLGHPDSSRAPNTWRGHLHWGRSQEGGQNCTLGTFTGPQVPAPQTPLLCRGAILTGGLLAFRLQAVFIAWNVLFQLPVSAWPIPHPWGFGVGPPLPGSLPGFSVLTLISRVLGSSLPWEILHQAVIAWSLPFTPLSPLPWL